MTRVWPIALGNGQGIEVLRQAARGGSRHRTTGAAERDAGHVSQASLGRDRREQLLGRHRRDRRSGEPVAVPGDDRGRAGEGRGAAMAPTAPGEALVVAIRTASTGCEA